MKLKNKLLLLAFSFLSACTPSYAATDLDVSKTYDMNGGVNYKDIPIKIADNQSPDMVNFISDDGSTYVRNGTRRFNTTALSTNPITSMYKGYASNGKSIFIVTSGDQIYISTFSDVTDENTYYDNHLTGVPVIFQTTHTLLQQDNNIPSRLPKANQKFSFETVNDEVFMVSESTNPIRYDINASSTSFVPGNPPKANFILQSGDYTILARTTDAVNRVFYSDVGNPYSWPTNNYRDLESKTGEKITGLAKGQDGVKIFTDNSIWNLTFTILSPLADGNQNFQKQFDGVGCIAPYSIANFGDGIFFLARDGFRILLGGQNVLVDDAIHKEITSKFIQSGKYQNTVAIFDRKNKWIWVSYEDDKAYPRGVNNKIIIYDLRLGQWYPIDGMNASSFCQWDGQGDKLELFYGDSIDGYVNEMDVPLRDIDAKHELSVINFDNDYIYTNNGCKGAATVSKSSASNVSTSIFAEGDASMKLTKVASLVETTCNPQVLMGNINAYLDKTDVSADDYFQFKFRRNTRHASQNLIVTLYLSGDITHPQQYISSHTFNDDEMGGNDSNQNFATIKIKISSFTSGASVADSLSRNVARLNFNFTGTSNEICWIDDFRVVQSVNNIKAYRYTKPFDLGFKNSKKWNSALITTQINPEARLNVDILDNFNRQIIGRTITGGYSDFIYISSGQNFKKIKKLDYSLAATSITAIGNDVNDLVPTPNYLYGLNRSTGILFKMELDSMSLLNSISSFASGNTFRNSYGLTFSNGFIYVLQMLGNRVLKFDENLIFISSYGLTTTSATGITTDGSNFYIIDSGKKIISRYDSDFSLKNESLFSSEDRNGLFGAVISVNQKYLFTSYRKQQDSPYFSISSATIVQLRDKFNLKILKEIEVTNGADTTNPLIIQSDNNYFYIAINSPVYLQKYHIDDMKLINQINVGTLDGMGVNSYYVDSDIRQIPLGTSSRYLQLLYRVEHPFDRIRIFDQTFIATKQELR